MSRQKTIESSPSFKKIATGFVLVAAVLLIFIVYFSFSKATIILEVDGENKQMDLDISVSATTTLSDLAGEVKYQEIEIQKEFEVANYKEVEGAAGGKMRIVNNNTSNQTLVKTTRFLAPNGLLFRLSETVNVPAKGEVVADVYADGKGAKYNIGANKFTIPGLSVSLQEKIYGISEQPMTGGIKKIGVMTEQDVNGAWETMSAELNEQVKNKLKIELKDNEKLLIRAKILGQKNSKNIGDEVDKFMLTAKVGVETVKINKDEYIEVAKEKYTEKLAQKISIMDWAVDDMQEKIKDFNAENGTVILQVSLSAGVQGAFDLTKFNKAEIAGFDRKGVEYYFSQYPSINNVEVHFSPFWVKSVPAVSDRIEIEVK